MKPVTQNFEEKAKETLLDSQIQKNLSGLYEGFHSARIQASSDTADWEELQSKGREIKEEVINNLDKKKKQNFCHRSRSRLVESIKSI